MPPTKAPARSRKSAARDNDAVSAPALPFAGRAPDQRTISIRGAREHNLKNVDLTIPRDRLVVFTGLSG